MLQNTRSHVQTLREEPEQGLDLSSYLDILKRRILYVVIPFVLVLTIGSAVVMLLPPVFLSQGKILVESQQIPTELVRPTVTAAARERIQVIQQRVMTRENMLAIADKFQVFGERRGRLSGTEVFDLMRERTSFEPFAFDTSQRREGVVAVTVGFEHERPDMAARVANELMTLVLREDARNRTSRATETTRFLEREAQKLQDEIAKIDMQVAELKRQQSVKIPDAVLVQLAKLQAELQERLTVFSAKHPDIIRIQRQIDALEKIAVRTPEAAGLDTLENQRATAQKNLEAALQRLSAARLGESLERDQFSERLEVLEQAVVPQKPVRPNRPKFLALVFAAAFMAGAGALVAREGLDNSVRSPRDLLSIADSSMIVTIPYIATKAEARRKKLRIAAVATSFVVVCASALTLTHLMFRPLDELWTSLLARLLV